MAQYAVNIFRLHVLHTKYKVLPTQVVKRRANKNDGYSDAVDAPACSLLLLSARGVLWQ